MGSSLSTIERDGSRQQSMTWEELRRRVDALLLLLREEDEREEMEMETDCAVPWSARREEFLRETRAVVQRLPGRTNALDGAQEAKRSMVRLGVDKLVCRALREEYEEYVNGAQFQPLAHAHLHQRRQEERTRPSTSVACATSTASATRPR